mmetsp:Transcript_28726/g.66723  ORF Transcript_28726/g.66723 Transcript_28726/m.66723 type:complete len:100 (-) Transcript_28726:347-646(-)
MPVCAGRGGGSSGPSRQIVWTLSPRTDAPTGCGVTWLAIKPIFRCGGMGLPKSEVEEPWRIVMVGYTAAARLNCLSMLLVDLQEASPNDIPARLNMSSS